MNDMDSNSSVPVFTGMHPAWTWRGWRLTGCFGETYLEWQLLIDRSTSVKGGNETQNGQKSG